MNLVCKLFSFFLNLFKQVVDVVTETLVTLIDAGVSVLEAAIDGLSSVGGALLSSPVGIIAIGLALWWLFSPGDDDESSKTGESISAIKGVDA